MPNSTRRWGVVRAFVVTMLFLARPNRITLGRKRKALLIAINYDDAPEQDIVRLKFPQRDLKDMRTLLKKKFDFRDEDIITLTDDMAEVEAGISRLPTRDHIMREVQGFINRGEDNMDYVLYYSGHADQHEEPPSDNPVEEDGFKEYITPMDTVKSLEREDLPESVIYDTFLHENIIVPLNKTKGCHLFAVFDSCHSATLLNLKHHRCNRVGTPKSAVRRAFRHFFLEDLVVPLRKLFSRSTTTVVDTSNLTSTPTRCNGLCLRVPNHSRKSTVICISACKDDQITVETDRTDTFTSAIIDLLQSKPKASLKDVMYTARDVPVKVLQAAKEHMEHMGKEESLGWWRRIRSRRVFTSTTPDTSPPADELMDVSALAGWSPQLSSDEPLDTNSTWLYSDPRTLNLDRHGRIKRPALESVQRGLSSSRVGTPSLLLPRTSSPRPSQL